jgi:aconitate hydratase
VAYALAGTVDIDLEKEPLGTGSDGKPVYLRDIWPSQKEISDTVAASLKPEMFTKSYGNVFDGNPKWNAIPVAGGELYAWAEASTYIHEPPFFQGLSVAPAPVTDIRGARVLVMVGDSVTTDHISPAGDIAGQPGRDVAQVARRHAARLQLVRLAARQRSGHGARHVRQHPPQEPAAPRQ